MCRLSNLWSIKTSQSVIYKTPSTQSPRNFKMLRTLLLVAAGAAPALSLAAPHLPRTVPKTRDVVLNVRLTIFPFPFSFELE